MIEFDGKAYTPEAWAEMVSTARSMLEEGWYCERRLRILRHDERLRTDLAAQTERERSK